MIDLSRVRLKPYDHQVVGVEHLIKNPFCALFDEMGAGKTKQTIDAAQVLFSRGLINKVLVICPSAVRSVWFDSEFGELKTHLWEGIPAVVTEYRGAMRSWQTSDDILPLSWVITNYDYIRDKDRLEKIVEWVDAKTLLVLDESSAVKSWRAKQTKACLKIRKRCGRVLLLNGTPIANSIGDLFSQAYLMHPKILDCKSIFHFQARYAIKGGWMGRQVVEWRDVEDIQRRLAPYVLRRLKVDCLDLPEKMPPVTLSVPLTPSTWKIYKEMRDEMLVWLDTVDAKHVAVAAQAAVRAMRLVQICSGFLGGLQDPDLYSIESDDEPEVDQESLLAGCPDWMEADQEALPLAAGTRAGQARLPGSPSPGGLLASPRTVPVGHEKLDLFFSWYEQKLEEDACFKLLLWTRFRVELARFVEEFRLKYPAVPIGQIHGGQKRDEREAAIRLLGPKSAPQGPVVVAGTPATGSMGLNLTAAHTVIYLSNDHNLKTRLQSMDRVHRPGQFHAVSYYDIVATGPKGQNTVDRAILHALIKKETTATWTTNAWRSALRE